MKKVVVIGGSAAGAKTAAKYKRMCPDSTVEMYTQESITSYSACGLPYFIAGYIENIAELIIRTPSEFEKQGIRTFVDHKCTKILPDEKTVIINGEKVHYDELVLATGTVPTHLNIKKMGLKNIFRIRTPDDAERIKEKMKYSMNAVIVGGGHIAIEILEALVNNGLSATVIEVKDQILPHLDKDIADMVEDYIFTNAGGKINFIKGDKVEEFLGETEFEGLITKNGREIKADFCVLATGVEPNIELARGCGIEIGTTGGIKVDNRMRTSIPNIWAAGDCTEKNCLITKTPVSLSLGSIANKEGRTCAINICGGDEIFGGVLCSTVARYFDFTIATTGLTEKMAKFHAASINIVPITTTVTKADRAGYMPNVHEITLKMIADKSSGEILGAQAIGKGDVNKRISAVSSAIQSGFVIDQLLYLDLAYSPPFGTPIDPLHEAAYRLKKTMEL